MEMIDVTKEIQSLITKAAMAEKADDALKFSQSASNAANAMATIFHVVAQLGFPTPTSANPSSDALS